MPIGQASCRISERRRTESAAIHQIYFWPGQYREPVPIVTVAGEQRRYHERASGQIDITAIFPSTILDCDKTPVGEKLLALFEHLPG